MGREGRTVFSLLYSAVAGFSDSSCLKDLVDEILNMKDFSHVNILMLMGVAFDSNKTPCLVMPFMSNGSLCEYLRMEDVRKELLWGQEEEPEEAVIVSQYLFSRIVEHFATC